MLPTSKNPAAPHDQVKIVRVSDKKGDFANLPSPDTRRWVTRRKAQVVSAVRNGVLTVEQACERYNLSREEFDSWRHLLDEHGVRGLRATRMQEYLPPQGRTRPAEGTATN